MDDGTRNAARSIAGQGKQASTSRLERARDLFHRAYTLVPAPTIALYEGRALAKLRRLVEAEEAYMRAARTPLDAESPEPFRTAVHDAEDDLLRLRLRMPKVTIVPSGPGAREPELNVTPMAVPQGRSARRELRLIPASTRCSRWCGRRARKLVFSVAEKQARTVEFRATCRPCRPEQDRRKSAPPNAKHVTAQPGLPGRFRRRWPRAGRRGRVVTGVISGLMAAAAFQARSSAPTRLCRGRPWLDKAVFRTLRAVSTVGYM